jgi:hypothetical protein
MPGLRVSANNNNNNNNGTLTVDFGSAAAASSEGDGRDHWEGNPARRCPKDALTPPTHLTLSHKKASQPGG